MTSVGRVIGWSPQGERCALNGMDCKQGLECAYNPKDPQALAYGICEPPRLGGIRFVGQGGRCALNGMDCQQGLECAYNPKDPQALAYGICEPPRLGGIRSVGQG